MRRWVQALALTASVAGGAVVACGSFGSDPDPKKAVKDAAPEATVTVDDPISTFDCEGTSCIAGETACCRAPDGKAGCYGFEAGGCPLPAPGDGGTDSGPAPSPLQCTSYRNCGNQGAKCCYHAGGGSSCQSNCQTGDVNLCVISTDSCGDKGKCVTMPAAPLPGVGMCIDESGGSGGTSGGGGGGGRF